MSNWIVFVTRYYEKHRGTITYSEALKEASALWNNPEKKQAFLDELDQVEQVPEDIPVVVEEVASVAVKQSKQAKSSGAKDAKYYQAKARYYKVKASKK